MKRQDVALWAVLSCVIAAGVFWLTQRTSSASVKEIEAACRAAVEDHLRAPGSAQFGAMVPVKAGEVSVASYSVGERYRVESWVDSHNGFGALLRTDFVCDVTVSDRGQIDASATMMPDR